MADSDVDIKISADSAEAKRAFKEAADAAKNAVGTMQEAFGGLGEIFEAVRGHLGALTAILAGGAFFKEAISATREFVGDVTMLAKATGLSAQEASGLNVALEDIGSSADSYTSALAKLTKQVRTNETGLNAMGIATRDANGQYLDGRELMDSTIATLNQYKEGTDRNLAAQVAFGKGAQEAAALLKLNTQIQEEGAKKAEELNLVIGPGTQAATKAYKLAMNDIGDVTKGVEVTIGKAVMPILTDLAQWFASTGPSVIAVFKPAAAGIADTMRIVVDAVKDVAKFFGDAFALIGECFNDATGQSTTFGQFVGNVCAVVGAAVISFKVLFQAAFEGIRGAVEVVIATVRLFADVIQTALVERNWSAVKASWKAGLADIETAVSESAARILKVQTENSDALVKLLDGEGYKRPEDKNQEVKKPSGSKAFVDPNTKEKDGPKIIAQYEAELAAKKLQIDEENALNGTFYQMTKQAEADFWQTKVATVDKGSKEYFQIEKKYIDARLALNKDAFDQQLASLAKQEEAIRYDYDAKLVLAQRELELIREKFGEQRAEYEKGLQAIQKLEQQKAEQTKKVQEQIAENRKAAALGAVELEEQQAELEVALMQKTDADLLSDLQAFENRRYAILLAAYAERRALAEKEGSPTELAKLNGDKEQLEQQHQLKIRAIQGQAALQQTALARSLYGTLQSGFASVISGMMKGTLNMRETLQQVYGSIADALSQAVAKMVADWLLGEIRKKAATLETSLAQIQAAAAAAAGNAYNAIVGIPYVGPFLAPAAAAVAYAGVIAFGASASAEGGYDIPAGVNPIVQAHASEMVLPAKHADVIRSLADNGGAAGAGGGGDIHLHVHAVDAQSVKRLFANNGEALVDALRMQRRNFNPA